MTQTSAESVIQFQDAPARTKNKRKTAVSSDPTARLPNVTIGTLAGFENGQPMVDFPGNPHGKPLKAITGVPLAAVDVGRQVTLAFADGDPEKPVILNLLLDPAKDAAQASPIDIQIDGERLQLTAKKEIVLRCGEASITLTAAGKVLLKGTYVLSRSSGYNKIKGAAVDIN